MAAKFDAVESTLRQRSARMIRRRASFSELGIGELSLASRIRRVHVYVGGAGADGLSLASRRRFPLARPRNQSPNTTATQKIRTDGDLWFRFGKQYEIVQMETIRAMKHTSEPGIRAHAQRTCNGPYSPKPKTIPIMVVVCTSPDSTVVIGAM
ncbi:hypothetical protein PISMIDRAFT_690355 [Pisolithus microcarpus 441]|uniref:Uncharacterized protein n=1 Tax=Pisolithus microcarpus 441 TaxID=765257 RepID=A0A0C9Y2S4_9AGAM|nr:hypothetical protein BKA83DRAFT_690355 [Pisolithus microcarpus]KIK11426.1 hypothetical protein PISMIDRAFT_690355 [Pisolithus microcarpus 441]